MRGRNLLGTLIIDSWPYPICLFPPTGSVSRCCLLLSLDRQPPLCTQMATGVQPAPSPTDRMLRVTEPLFLFIKLS